MRIAIMGAGSLGIIIGGLITKGTRGQHEVFLIDAKQDNVDALNQNGAIITGFLEEIIPVTAITPDKMSGKYDLVILLTKQTFNEVAVPQLMPYLHENSTVCTLQNGIPEESVAAMVGKERTVGGAVGFGATWQGPGVSALTSTKETLQKYAFDIGELDGSITPRIKMVKEILDHVGNAEIVTNLMDIRWTKVLMNATFSGMSAALGCTFGDVLNNADAMNAVAHIADETAKVTHALGYKLAYMQGIDMEIFEIKPGETPADKMEYYHKTWGRHAALKASMLQDLEKGIKTEINYINGHVAKKGREVGVPTPYNDLVVKLVSEAEAKKVVPDFATNIKFFQKR